MTSFEELIADTLGERALDIAFENVPPPPQQVGPAKSHRPMRAVLVGIACAGLIVAGFAVIQSRYTSERPDRAPAGSPDIHELTGKAVGDALGLKEKRWPLSKPCAAFAEYESPWGFCLDHVVSGPTATYLLTRQIQGHTPTVQDSAYLADALELYRLEAPAVHPLPDAVRNLRANMSHLFDEVTSPRWTVDHELPSEVAHRARALLGKRYVDLAVGTDQASYIVGVMHLKQREVPTLALALGGRLPILFEPRTVPLDDPTRLQRMVLSTTASRHDVQAVGVDSREGQVVVGVVPARIAQVARLLAQVQGDNYTITTAGDGPDTVVCWAGPSASHACLRLRPMSRGSL
jgi:hypothetical protein